MTTEPKVDAGRNGGNGHLSPALSPKGGEGADLLAALPWLRRLPTPLELKALRAEAEWNPSAGAALRAAVARLQELVAAARADGHDVVNPTHLAEVRGRPIGYASIEPVALMTMWSDSRNPARVTAQMLNQAENEAARMGYGTVLVPCETSSPFYRALGGLGYRQPKNATIFMKNLR